MLPSKFIECAVFGGLGAAVAVKLASTPVVTVIDLVMTIDCPASSVAVSTVTNVPGSGNTCVTTTPLAVPVLSPKFQL